MSQTNGSTPATDATDEPPAVILMPDAEPELGIQQQVDNDPTSLPDALLEPLNDAERKTIEALQDRVRKQASIFSAVSAEMQRMKAQFAEYEQSQLKLIGKIEGLREQIGDHLTHAHLRAASQTASDGAK